MPKAKKPYNLEQRIVTALRNIHRGWPNKNECLKSVKVGKRFRCQLCRRENFRKEYMRADHIDAIGGQPKKDDLGRWSPTWDEYIARFFSPFSNYQALCIDCHEAKSLVERQMKKASR